MTNKVTKKTNAQLNKRISNDVQDHMKNVRHRFLRQKREASSISHANM